ncbi:MAG: hypothetical protein E6K66_11855 [Nitrospirae bacterium]|nr:MAG: hypothetical protein E6K66_11855 [Nitrospirota bacterium]
MVLSPRKLALTLALVVLCLLLGHVITQSVKIYYGYNTLGGIIPEFDLNSENNIPTWYSSSALLLASALLAMIALVKLQWQETYARHWVVLAVIFLFLSMDEAASIHEKGSELALLIMPSLVDFGYLSRYLYFAWVVFGVPFVLLFSLAYLRFLIHLPAKTRSLFVLAGIIYVGGALGVEMLGARDFYLYGEGRPLVHSMLILWEEGFEMFGIVIFIYALTSYLGFRSSSYLWPSFLVLGLSQPGTIQRRLVLVVSEIRSGE